MSEFRVEIDLPPLQGLFQETAQAAVTRAIDVLASYASDRVLQLANEKLDAKQAKAYSACVYREKVKPFEQAIVLKDSTGAIARLETGVKAFDIKAALLRSPKAKQGRNGPYIDVPFDHAVRKRDPGNFVKSRVARATVQALMSEALVSQHRVTAFAGKWKPNSKRRRLADMRIKPLSMTKTSQTTFRRVSANSAPESWLRKESKGLDIFKLVTDEVEKMKTEVIESALKQAASHRKITP